MTYADCINWLYSLQKSGVKLGLDNMRQLCHAAGNPQSGLKFIHLAGTNGKGSCSAFIESILREAGYRTGLYTSPHLVEFGERIQINRVPLQREEVVREVRYLHELVEQCRGRGFEPTFFEVTTLMAFRCFQQAGAEIVVLETGLGGRLDSTNIIDPECCLVTSIGYDHMNYLGDTLEQIAAEKAGIFKPGRPVVLASGMPPSALRVFLEHAGALNCAVSMADTAESVHTAEGNLQQTFTAGAVSCAISLMGNYQPGNAMSALKVCEQLESLGWEIPLAARLSGLRKTRWAGRFDLIEKNPPLVVDGAHNPDGLAGTLESWRICHGCGPEEIIFGCLLDKDVTGMIQLIDLPGVRVHLVALHSVRSAAFADLKPYFRQASVFFHGELSAALQVARASGKGILITGSLYLAGQAMAFLQKREHEVLLNG